MLQLRLWRKAGKVSSRAEKLNCRREDFKLFQELLGKNQWEVAMKSSVYPKSLCIKELLLLSPKGSFWKSSYFYYTSLLLRLGIACYGQNVKQRVRDSPWPYYKNKVWWTYCHSFRMFEPELGTELNSKASPFSYWLSLLASLKGSIYMLHWNNYLTISFETCRSCTCPSFSAKYTLKKKKTKTKHHIDPKTVSGFAYT